MQQPLAIERFTNNLPFDISEQLTHEYQNRLSEIKYLTSGKFDYYTPLSKNLDTISFLLAMSIFYKRIVSNLNSAVHFTNRVINNSSATAVTLGKYEFGRREIRQVNYVVTGFHKLMNDFSIDATLFEYEETKQFLRKVKRYKQSLTDNG